MDVARFCFFECKPQLGFLATSKIGSACLSLDSNELAHATDRSGNAVDPALFVKVPQNPNGVQVVHQTVKTISFLQVRVVGEVERADPIIADTHAMADATQAQAINTRSVTKAIRDGQVKTEQDIHDAGTGGVDEMESIRSIMADRKRSEEAAQEAQVLAGQAEEAVINARKAALEGGVRAGKDAMESVKVADKKSTADLAEFRDKLVNKQEMKAIAASMKASEPYHLSMMRAQKTIADYTAQAQADMGKAKGLQDEATALANQANAASDAASAQTLYDQAKAKAAEAKELALSAENSFAVADQMNKDIPKYAGAAQAAAAKAAFDSMPAWQPAPPMPFPAYVR